MVKVPENCICEDVREGWTMSGGLDAPDLLHWASFLTRIVALALPLLFAFYGLFKSPRDSRLTSIGLLMAAAVGLAWFVAVQLEEKKDREVEALQEEIAVATAEPERRTFSPEARQMMIERLQNVHGPSVFVLANASDEETTLYSREIVAVLKESGWDVPASFGMIFTPVILPGQDRIPSDLILGVTPEVPEHIIQTLLATFRDAGITIRLGPHWPGTEHPISILVGPKLD
jgi:hypothetical protein